MCFLLFQSNNNDQPQTEEKNVSTVEQPQCNWRWYTNISVEPTMFLYMFAFMITSVVEQAFFVNKACLVNNNFTADICDNLNEYPEIKKQVQVSMCDCWLVGGKLKNVVISF